MFYTCTIYSANSSVNRCMHGSNLSFFFFLIWSNANLLVVYHDLRSVQQSWYVYLRQGIDFTMYDEKPRFFILESDAYEERST